MFSRENRRFSVLIFAGVLIVAFTIGGIIDLINKEHSNNVYMLTAFAALIIGQIFTMARTEQAAAEQRRQGLKADQSREVITQKVEEIKHTVEESDKKTNGNLTKAIETAATAVKEAVLTPAPGQEQMPRTPQELQSLLKVFSREICRSFVDQAKIDADKVAKETVEKTRAEIESAARETVRIVVEELKTSGVIK